MAEAGRDQEGDDSEGARCEVEGPARPSRWVLLGAAVSTGIACALLGAFSGCTIDLGRMVRGSAPPRFMVAGGVAGLALGAAIGIRRYASKRRPAPHVAPLAYGVACAACAVLAYFTGAYIFSAHPRIASRVPIRLDRAGRTTATFEASLSVPYTVMLETEPALKPDEIAVLMGQALSNPAGTRVTGEPRVTWTVSNVPDSERHTFWNDGHYGTEEAGLTLGQFTAQAGQEYEVAVEVLRPSPQLHIRRAYLEVRYSFSDWARVYPPAFMAWGGAFWAGVISVVLLLYGLTVRTHYRWKAAAKCAERVSRGADRAS